MRVFEVVDGQQRLATFMLTISLIIQGLEEVGRQARKEKSVETADAAVAYAEQLQQDFLYYTEVVGGRRQPKLRLSLSKADQEYFEQLLEKRKLNPTRESHKRLQRAYNKIRQDLIKPITDDPSTPVAEKLAKLLNLRDAVLDDCYVIHIVSDNHAEAYRLFAILNDRGRTLSDGDLLRAHSLEMLEGHVADQKKTEEYWDLILSERPSQIDKFLRSYYVSFVGERAPLRDLFDKFRARFFDFETPATAETARLIRERVHDIASQAEVFSRLVNGEWPYETPTVSAWKRDRLYRLVDVMRHDLCLPLLLSAAVELPEDKFAEMVLLLERFVFRYIIIVGGHPGALAEIYYKHSVAIREERYKYKDFRADLQSLANSGVPDDLFEANLQSWGYSETSSQRNRLVKHFLTTVEDFYGWFDNGANGAPSCDEISHFDIKQISIEHIYPQNPKTPDKSLELWKHKIGNLTFWGPDDNSRVGNEPFAAKKARYATSRVRLTKELARYGDVLTEEQLKNRHAHLIKVALKIYRI